MAKPFLASVVGSNECTERYIGVYLNAELQPVMSVLSAGMEIHITREQAMEFFGLVPAPAVKPTMTERIAQALVAEAKAV